MSLAVLLKNKQESVSHLRVVDAISERSSSNLLGDYKNESIKTKYPEIDGVNVLGAFSGIFFVPDGKSVNERFYPRSFWENVLKDEELQKRLEDRVMFGTIGHEDKYVDDVDLASGKVSHIVTKLWIDESTGLGMGEALILGTTSGQNLYRFLKAGCNIKISSRAYGDYIPGQLHEGMPIMDASTYRLEGFDVVLFPGFNETKLTLNESKSKNDIKKDKLIVENIIKRRSNIMAAKSKKLLKAESDLTSELKRSKLKAESDVIAKNKIIEKLEADLKNAETERDQWKVEGSKLLESYKKYNSLGTLKSIQEKLDKLVEFEKISNDPEDLRKTIVEATEKINSGKNYIAESESALDMSESAIKQYLDIVGTVSQAKRDKIKSERALKQYTSLGTISELISMKAKYEEMQQSMDKAKLEEDCRKYSNLTGQTIESVQKVFESSKSREDAISILESLAVKKAKIHESKSESKQEVKSRFKRESVINSKNNRVLSVKNESVDSAEIALSKSILKSYIR